MPNSVVLNLHDEVGREFQAWDAAARNAQSGLCSALPLSGQKKNTQTFPDESAGNISSKSTFININIYSNQLISNRSNRSI